MPTIAPWLRPTDVLGSMSEGGRLGLASAEAADNVRLAYARLAQQGAEDTANREMQKELARAHFAAAQRQQDLLNQFRQQSIAARERGLDISEEGLGFREQTGEDKARLLGKAKPLAEGKLTDLQKHDLDRASEDLTAAQKLHSGLVAKGENPDEIEAAKTALDAAREAYRKTRGQFDQPERTPQPPPNIYMGPAMQTPEGLMAGKMHARQNVPSAAAAPTEPPKVATKKDYDALPSGTIYIGKDGKKYRKP